MLSCIFLQSLPSSSGKVCLPAAPLLQLSLSALTCAFPFPPPTSFRHTTDYSLPYTSGNWGSEFFLLWMMTFVEAIRIFFGEQRLNKRQLHRTQSLTSLLSSALLSVLTGMKGNLTEQKMPMILLLVFTLPTVFGLLFFMLWQTYV